MTFWWNRAYIKIISNCSYLSICWWNVMPRYLISPAIYRHLTSVLQIWLRFTSKHGFLTRNWDVTQQNFIDRYLLDAFPNIAYIVHIFMYLDDGIVDLCTCPRARVPAPSRRKVNCPRPRPRRTGFSKLTYAAFLHFISLSLSVLH